MKNTKWIKKGKRELTPPNQSTNPYIHSNPINRITEPLQNLLEPITTLKFLLQK